MQIENVIICDKLLGLLTSFQSLLNFNVIQTKLGNEWDGLKVSLHKMDTFDSQLIANLTEFGNNHKSLKKDFDDLWVIKYTVEDRIDKVIKELRDRLKTLQEENRTLMIDNERLAKENNKFEQQLNVLSSELMTLRKNSHTHQFKGNSSICKNCKLPYLEEENLNWSCKTHFSKFNGSMYWCCGKSEMYAEGCILSKHFPVDKEEEPIQQNLFCSNCKEFGHSSKVCHKDPNTRSNFDPQQELERIRDYKKKKNKVQVETINRSITIHHKRLQTLDVIESEFSDFEEINEIKSEWVQDDDENLFRIDSSSENQKGQNWVQSFVKGINNFK